MVSNHIMFDEAPIDVSKEVNMVWDIANILRGPYRSDKYKDVIIPMVIIRRFESALFDTKDKVLEFIGDNPEAPAQVIERVAGFDFYNTSPYTLELLLDDPINIKENFKSYLRGFSQNVNDILVSLDFDKQIEKLDSNDKLYAVIKAFSELDLDPQKIDNVKMGYIFEDLIRRFSENAEAGDHYTSRDIVRLMVDILLAEGSEDILEPGKVITILDQAAGTGGMLSTAYNHIYRRNKDADIVLYSQEINPESYAIALAELLIKGQDANNVKLQDTMKKDSFPDMKMRYVIENPPFGQAWGGKNASTGVEEAVREEYNKEYSRFPAGLPGTGDMQLLFFQSAIDKMDDEKGRAAIVSNGSPLFTGGVSSGESQIRRWMLEEDLVEAIIALPADMFYNTGIPTYIWILSKNKSDKRKGKVQLINAVEYFVPLRKSLGQKRREISRQHRNDILELYINFEETEDSKIFKNEDFIYREYAIYQPMQRNYKLSDSRIDKMIDEGTLDNIYNKLRVEELMFKKENDKLTKTEENTLSKNLKNKALYDDIIDTLKDNVDDKLYDHINGFDKKIYSLLKGKTTAANINKIVHGLSKRDKTAQVQKDSKGNVILDKDTKDIEIVKMSENIEDYMEKEVLPHIPDAIYQFEENMELKTPRIRTGAEIPFTRLFYKFKEPRKTEDILKDIVLLEKKLISEMESLVGKEGLFDE